MTLAQSDATPEPAWVHGHPHEPNPTPPPGDGAFLLISPEGVQERIAVERLQTLPYREVAECYIVSTGHGKSGPFVFGGVALHDLLSACLAKSAPWRHIDVISADGFGARLQPEEVLAAPPHRPILLAYARDGSLMSRQAGLVRLIVPSETNDALKQVKWIERIVVAPL